jgi:hypothetical protein
MSAMQPQPALASLAGANTHIDDLIGIFESRREGLSENDMQRSLTNAREMNMKQISVQSFFHNMS